MGHKKNKHALQGQGLYRAPIAREGAQSEPGVCRICGCTDNAACIVDGVPCSWVNEDHTLCSACV